VNHSEAAQYIKLSADQGDANGQFNYGISLENSVAALLIWQPPKDTTNMRQIKLMQLVELLIDIVLRKTCAFLCIRLKNQGV
jgi:TPR repeat protein